MSLMDEVEKASRGVATDSITMSIGELSSYYKERDLEISPQFQRAFRWPISKKSNLIESILLSIPIPSVFVFENENGSWELVDGLQRLSTIFEFMGILRDAESGATLPPSCLIKTRYLENLQGAVWRKSPSILEKSVDEQKEIGSSLQRRIRTSRIQVEILRHPSDVETKYDLFQRLNRGGETANAQEVRNSLCVMASSTGFSDVKRCAESDLFLKLFKVTSTGINQQRHIEYLMRFMVHSYFDFDPKIDLESFIDDRMRQILTSPSDFPWTNKIVTTMKRLEAACGEQALLPELGGSRNANRVSLRQLEAIAVGIARNIEEIENLTHPNSFVHKKVKEFWDRPETSSMSAAGLNSSVRLQRTVPFGDAWFKPDLA